MSRFFMKTVAIAVAASHLQGAEASGGGQTREGSPVDGEKKTALRGAPGVVKRTFAYVTGIPGKAKEVVQEAQKNPKKAMYDVANSGPGRFTITAATSFFVCTECVDRFQGQMWKLFCGWKHMSTDEKCRASAFTFCLGYCFKKECISVHPRKILQGALEIASSLKKLMGMKSITNSAEISQQIGETIKSMIPEKYQGCSMDCMHTHPACAGAAVGCCAGVINGFRNGEMTVSLGGMNVKD